MEFLYTDPRKKLDPKMGCSYHNIGGIDECFPTVAPCVCPVGVYGGTEFKDHGYLWQQE